MERHYENILTDPRAKRDHTFYRLEADYLNYLREVTLRERGNNKMSDREKERLMMAFLPTLKNGMDQANSDLIEAEKRLGRALNPQERA